MPGIETLKKPTAISQAQTPRRQTTSPWRHLSVCGFDSIFITPHHPPSPSVNVPGYIKLSLRTRRWETNLRWQKWLRQKSRQGGRRRLTRTVTQVMFASFLSWAAAAGKGQRCHVCSYKAPWQRALLALASITADGPDSCNYIPQYWLCAVCHGDQQGTYFRALV